MKKFLVVVVTMLGFSLAEALLNLALGIIFPSFEVAVIHNLLIMTNGAVLLTVLRAKIE